jgi:hypothetical protein
MNNFLQTSDVNSMVVSPDFSSWVWKGGALQVAEELVGVLMVSETPLSPCLHHPGARRAPLLN